METPTSDPETRPEFQTCKICDESLPWSDYAKHGTSRTGYNKTCKTCVKSKRGRNSDRVNISMPSEVWASGELRGAKKGILKDTPPAYNDGEDFISKRDAKIKAKYGSVDGALSYLAFAS